VTTRLANPLDLDAEDARVRAAYGRRGETRRYSWFTDAHLLAVQERERHVLDLLRRSGIDSLADMRILELGCGTGAWLRDLIKWGARPGNITGVDLLPDRLVEAQRLCPSEVNFVCASAAAVTLPAASFDIVLQSMLITSVLDAEARRAIARVMLRALRPGGVILWYDYHVNNPANPDVRGVSRAEIRALFPHCRIDLRRVTLAAPLARFVLPKSKVAYTALQAIPLLRTHYVGMIRPA
jgi:ubiquinone/menaquinone biosynthesis C-methylase UbiE